MPIDGRLETSQARDSLLFEFTVTNAGTDRVELKFRSGLQADFAVLADDTEVWRWSDGKVFTQMLETKPLDPGESVTYTRTWSDPSPGTYTTVATLEASNESVQARANVRVHSE